MKNKLDILVFYSMPHNLPYIRTL